MREQLYDNPSEADCAWLTRQMNEVEGFARSLQSGPGGELGIDWREKDVERTGIEPSELFPLPSSHIEYHDVRVEEGDWFSLPRPCFIQWREQAPASPGDVALDSGAQIAESTIARVWERLAIIPGSPFTEARRALTALYAESVRYLTPRKMLAQLSDGSTQEYTAGDARDLHQALLRVWRGLWEGEDAAGVLDELAEVGQRFRVPSELLACQRSLVGLALADRDALLPEAYRAADRWEVAVFALNGVDLSHPQDGEYPDRDTVITDSSLFMAYVSDYKDAHSVSWPDAYKDAQKELKAPTDKPMSWASFKTQKTGEKGRGRIEAAQQKHGVGDFLRVRDPMR